MSDRTCIAKGCDKQVPSTVVMCRMHWVMIPGDIQTRIYEQFKNDPKGMLYIQALRDAVVAVSDKEGLRRKHAAEERHEFREALHLLRGVVTALGVDSLETDLKDKVESFLRRHVEE